jgi:hypothetical protein
MGHSISFLVSAMVSIAMFGTVDALDAMMLCMYPFQARFNVLVARSNDMTPFPRQTSTAQNSLPISTENLPPS